MKRRALLIVLAAGFLLGTTETSQAIITDWGVDHTTIRLGDVSTWTA